MLSLKSTVTDEIELDASVHTADNFLTGHT